MTGEKRPFPAARLVVSLVYLAVVVTSTWYAWHVDNHEDPNLAAFIPMALTLPTWLVLYGLVHGALGVPVLLVIAAVLHVLLAWTPLWGPRFVRTCRRLVRTRSLARVSR